MSPGVKGWLAVAAVVAIADAIALHDDTPTMSAEFAYRSVFGILALGAVAAHLRTHRPGVPRR